MARRASLCAVSDEPGTAGSSMFAVVDDATAAGDAGASVPMHTKLWVPHDTELWALATCIGPGEAPDSAKVVLEEVGGEAYDVALESCHAYDPHHSAAINDISSMGDLHEAPLLDLLKQRFKAGSIYTDACGVLIAMNPFREIEGLYDEAVEHPRPHLFSIADAARAELVETSKSQAILMSGESGAGKTQSTRLVLGHLARDAAGDASLLGPKVMASTPLLEAFGNAQTPHNKNSSRFGKYIRLQLCAATGVLESASTEVYLLETSRLVLPGKKERNFHALYYLLAADDATRAALKLPSAVPSEYRYLSCSKLQDLTDEHRGGLDGMLSAWAGLGLVRDDLQPFLRVTAAMLMLGNVEFGENEDEQAFIVGEGTDSNAATVAELLGIDEKALRLALTGRTMYVDGKGQRVPFSMSQAGDARDATARAVYEKMFNHLVMHVNTVLTTVEQTPKYVGVLDLHGFEILFVNSLEQLLINYGNERLQLLFNDTAVSHEAQIYEKEGVEMDFVLSSDQGLPSISLLDRRPDGLLRLLDEQTAMGPRASDRAFVTTADKNHLQPKGGTDCESISTAYYKPRFQSSERFGIRHFAGDVMYDCAGMVVKNRAQLWQDLSNCLNGSTVEWVSDAFERRVNEPGRIVKVFAATNFRTQMDKLIKEIAHCTPRFVRCVKPVPGCDPADPFKWDNATISRQLRFFGIMELVRIRRMAYPERIEHAALVRSHGALLGRHVVSDLTLREKCETLIRETEGASEIARVGNTLVFGREGLFAMLDARLGDRLAIEQVKLSKACRMFFARKKFAKKRWASVRLEVFSRTRAAKRKFAQKRSAASLIAAAARGVQARKLAGELRSERAELEAVELAEYEAKLEAQRVAAEQKRRRMSYAAKKIESQARVVMAKHHLAELKDEQYKTIKIQSKVRQRKAERDFRSKIGAVMQIQSVFRMAHCRRLVDFARGLRAPWARFINPNEVVLTTSPTLQMKKSTFGFSTKSRRVQLIVTSKPRMVWVDVCSSTAKQTADPQRLAAREWGHDAACVAVGNKADTFSLEFPSHRAGAKNAKAKLSVIKLRHFDLVSGNANKWCYVSQLIEQFRDPKPETAAAFVDPIRKEMTTSLALLKRVRQMNLEAQADALPIEMQGFLIKQALSGKKSFKLRYFLLQGGKLRFYKADGDKAPSTTFDLVCAAPGAEWSVEGPMVAEKGAEKAAGAQPEALVSLKLLNGSGKAMLVATASNEAEATVWAAALRANMKATCVADLQRRFYHSPEAMAYQASPVRDATDAEQGEDDDEE